MNRASPRILLVEGQEDLRVIPYLAEAAGVSWGDKNNPIVRIVQYNGVEELLAPGAIETQLKASGLTSLGIIVDADESVEARWAAIRTRILPRYPQAPIEPVPEGVVLQDDEG